MSHAETMPLDWAEAIAASANPLVVTNERPVEPVGGLPSCCGGFFKCCETSDDVFFAVAADAGAVFAVPKPDALDPSLIVAPSLGISAVVSMPCRTKIVDAVVQRIVVDVVDFVRDGPAMDYQPRDAMGEIPMIIDDNHQVALLDTACGASSKPGVPRFQALFARAPLECASLRIIIESSLDIFTRWQSFASHA